MNSPLTNPSSQPLMTSKLRFTYDGTADVYVKLHFSQLSTTSPALLGPANHILVIQTTHFDPYLISF